MKETFHKYINILQAFQIMWTMFLGNALLNNCWFVFNESQITA